MSDFELFEPAPAQRPAPPRARFPWLGVLLCLLAITIVLEPGWLRRLVAPAKDATPRAVTARGALGPGEQMQVEIFEQTSPSVVFITNVARRVRRGFFGGHDVLRIPQGTGSGFIWDATGHVVTNFHVIQGASEIEVALADGSRQRAQVVGVAPDKDLAVLKISGRVTDLRPIPVGSSGDLKVGQSVFAIGNPFGFDHTMSTGIVSGLGREITAATGRTIEDVIQTDAAINPGNSGGPLLDSAGRLIGVNTAIYSPTGSYAGIGFAVPVDTVNRVAAQLIAHGKLVRPTLGISIVNEPVARRLGVKTGVLIGRAMPGTGAEKAELRGTAEQADGSITLGDVIISVGGEEVVDLDDLFHALEGHAPGDTVPVGIVRDGTPQERKVELGAP